MKFQRVPKPVLARLALVALAGIAFSPGAHAASVVVANFSFEDDVASGPGQVVTFVPSGWVSFNQGAPSDIGSQWADGVDYTINTPLATPAEGNQYCYVNMFNPAVTGGIFLDVGELLANTQYTLTVAIGSRADRMNSPGIISLINGIDNTGTVLATGGGIPATQNTWQDYTISFTTGNSVSDDLIIALSVLGNGTTIQADFDNVRLDATAVPEPSTVALCLVGGLGMVGLIRRQRG